MVRPDDVLTAKQRRKAAAIFRGEDPGISACMHCAGIHDRVAGQQIWYQPCPRVKSVSWHVGEIASVEYWPEGSWPREGVIFPSDDVFDTEDEEGTAD